MTRPIIILHGWGSSAEAWKTPKELLEKAGFSVFAPDLPGFGSEPAPDTPWSVSDYVNFVLDYAKNNGLDKFILLGHSFGARIAIKLTALNPDQVTKLVLTGVPIKRADVLKIAIFYILAKLGKLFFLIPPFSFLALPARKFLYNLTGERDYFQLGTIEKKLVVMRETFKNVVNEDQTGYLKRLLLPTLIIWGRQDKVTPVSLAMYLSKEIPQVELKIIENASHRLPYDLPDIFTQEIVAFLNK